MSAIVAQIKAVIAELPILQLPAYSHDPQAPGTGRGFKAA